MRFAPAFTTAACSSMSDRPPGGHGATFVADDEGDDLDVGERAARDSIISVAVLSGDRARTTNARIGGLSSLLTGFRRSGVSRYLRAVAQVENQRRRWSLVEVEGAEEIVRLPVLGGRVASGEGSRAEDALDEARHQ